MDETRNRDIEDLEDTFIRALSLAARAAAAGRNEVLRRSRKANCARKAPRVTRTTAEVEATFKFRLMIECGLAASDPSAFPPVSPNDPHRELKLMRLGLGNDIDKAYVRHFNGQLRPLTLQGVSNAEPLAAYDLIHQLLLQCPLIKVDRCHMGGSFGRRTLVRGAFDLDLSVFVTEFRGRKLDLMAGDWSGEAGEALQRDMQRAVAAYLCKQGLSDVVEVEHGTHYKHCINVKVRGVDVDIKMVGHVEQGSAQVSTKHRGKAQRDRLLAALWDTPAHLRRADPAREAALSEALTAVMKDTSDRIKSVARLIKCWYKHSLERKIPHVPSVLLEVLTMAAAWRQCILKPEFQRGRDIELRLFLGTLDLLDAVASRKEVPALEVNPVWGYTLAQANSCAQAWLHDDVKVLHPIDPTCNLAAPQPGRAVRWAALAREARELRSVVLSKSMWELLERSSLAPAIRALKAAA